MIEIHRGFRSRIEGFPRTVRVFMPERYAKDPATRFGVLYMQDGQNVFDHPESARRPTWNANHALEDLVARQEVPPWMIVAVDHGLGRFEDYSPWDEPRQHVKGRAGTYARFLTDELKPWVDRTFPTRGEAGSTAVMGSSLGGLVSLFLGLRHGDVFGRVGALSPSVMWCEDGLFRHWREKTPHPLRLYVDAGEKEGFGLGTFPMNYGEKVAAFGAHLRSLGYGEDELRVILEPGGQHSEADWQRRLPSALRWLLH